MRGGAGRGGEPQAGLLYYIIESVSIQMEFRFKPQSDQGFTVLSTFIHFVDFNPLPVLIHCTSQRITWVIDQPGVGEARGTLFSREPKAGPTTWFTPLGWVDLNSPRTLYSTPAPSEFSYTSRALEGFFWSPTPLLPGEFLCWNLRFLRRESPGCFPSAEGKAIAARGSASQKRYESAAPKTAEVVTERYRPGSQLRVLLGDPGTGLRHLDS